MFEDKEAPQAEKRTYSRILYCENCFVQTTVDIPYGIRTSYFLLNNNKCNNCGCNALHE